MPTSFERALAGGQSADWAASASGSQILALVPEAFGCHGGIAQCMRDVMECLASSNQNFAVTLLARHGDPRAEIPPRNIEWQTAALGGKIAFALTALSVLRDPKGFGLVLCGHINLLPLARIAAWQADAPLVLYLHGMEAWRPPRNGIARKWVEAVARVISVSDTTSRRFQLWSGIDPERITVVPNTVKLERFGIGAKNRKLEARYGIEGRRVLMTLCRHCSTQRHKGVDEIISILPRLVAEFPDLVYLVAGGGDDISRLRDKAARVGLAERVVFTGVIHEAEKAEHYRLADAFALTGRGDGFGIVLLEAMACGIPVVASELDGSRDAVRNGLLGGLVNPDDPESLVAGISTALRQPRQVPDGLHHFSYENFCQRLNATLVPMIGGGK